MIEQENAQVARKAYQLFSQGDINGILDLYADEVEFVFPGPADLVPMAGTFRGKEQVRKFFGLVNENLEFTLFEPREFVPHGELVIVIGHDKGKVRKTGKDFEEDWVHIARYQNGKLIHWQAFIDTARVAADFTPAKAQATA